jgi:hypothetical protein
MTKRSSMLSTVLAAFLSTALAGGALVWAAGAGTGAAPAAKSTEVAVADTGDAQARADAMRERMADTRAKIDALHEARARQPKAAKTPKPPKAPKPPKVQPPVPVHVPVTVSAECLRDPLCIKR